MKKIYFLLLLLPYSLSAQNSAHYADLRAELALLDGRAQCPPENVLQIEVSRNEDGSPHKIRYYFLSGKKFMKVKCYYDDAGRLRSKKIKRGYNLEHRYKMKLYYSDEGKPAMLTFKGFTVKRDQYEWAEFNKTIDGDGTVYWTANNTTRQRLSNAELWNTFHNNEAAQFKRGLDLLGIPYTSHQMNGAEVILLDANQQRTGCLRREGDRYSCFHGDRHVGYLEPVMNGNEITAFRVLNADNHFVRLVQ